MMMVVTKSISINMHKFALFSIVISCKEKK
jgi:hypothetical protein